MRNPASLHRAGRLVIGFPAAGTNRTVLRPLTALSELSWGDHKVNTKTLTLALSTLAVLSTSGAYAQHTAFSYSVASPEIQAYPAVGGCNTLPAVIGSNSLIGSNALIGSNSLISPERVDRI